jgi:hypothetical protein
MDYKNGKIYKLISDDTDKIYIGSTTSDLSKRIYEHKVSLKRWKNKTGPYITSFEIMKYDNYEMILIEDYPCDNRNQLYSRERYWMDKFKGICVNKCMYRGGNRKETWLAYANSHKEEQKIYYEENKKKIYEKSKEKRKIKITCSCGSIFPKCRKSEHVKTKKHINHMKQIEELKLIEKIANYQRKQLMDMNIQFINLFHL